MSASKESSARRAGCATKRGEFFFAFNLFYDLSVPQRRWAQSKTRFYGQNSRGRNNGHWFGRGLLRPTEPQTDVQHQPRSESAPEGNKERRSP
ncbi:hypothetical protein NDU88_004116 [Pleurodeles waltl]|uniref:Uncharacterized protein n=1 Tax=Pleurodeles waltl TaxID=8319 RepID=A0AAV7V2L2_PLEWA|nr:hypothetical protein NDU88_004116 [Pleurodeles waltl]